MNLRKTICALACVVPMLASAQTQVIEYSPAASAEGVAYALPLTRINIDVKAIKTVYHPGEYAKYADRFLHVQGVKRTEETSWKVADINVFTDGVPDSLRTYVIKQKDKSSASNVQMTNRGVLVAINTEQQLPDYTLPQGSSTNNAKNGKKYMTSEMLEATSNAKIAELIAQEIYDIRDSKNSIRRGQVESMPKDGASLRIVLDDLDEQEEALTQMFIGYTDTVVVYKRYTFCPLKNIDKKVQFRFSSKLGFVDADDLAGVPYYINVIDKKSVQLPTEKEEAKRKINGVVYCIPGSARVVMSTMTNIVYDQELPVAQFGTVDMLNNALFNKGAAPKVTLNPATGSLLRIE